MNYPKADAIILEVACRIGVSYGDIKGPFRHKTVANARHIAMAAVRRRLGLSYPELGLVFSRNHSSVMSGVKRVESDPDMRALLDSILEATA